MVRVPVRLPVAVGLKNTPMAQLTPGSTLLVQALSTPKSAGLAVTLLMVRGRLPSFLRVTVWGRPVVPTYWLEKVTLVGDKVAVGAVPVPVKLITCGLLGASSAMVNAPLRSPMLVGTKVTLTVHETPAPRVEGDIGQELLRVKSPLTAIPVMLNATVPVLLRVTVCAALVLPTSWAANVRLDAERLRAGPRPVPERLTVCGLPGASEEMVSSPVFAPGAVGVKVTLIVQRAPAATLLPQSLVSANSALMAMLLIVNVALPVLLSMTG
jgi:hypothetical protein